jgi:hypothetical protein
MLNGRLRLLHSLPCLVARLSPHIVVRLADAQEQAIRAPVDSVLKTQETMLTATHLQDKTVPQLIANLRQQLSKKGKAEEKDPCAYTCRTGRCSPYGSCAREVCSRAGCAACVYRCLSRRRWCPFLLSISQAGELRASAAEAGEGHDPRSVHERGLGKLRCCRSRRCTYGVASRARCTCRRTCRRRTSRRWGGRPPR